MPNKRLFTDEHIGFIKENYYELGAAGCCEFLPFSPQQIRAKASKLGIRTDPDRKRQTCNNTMIKREEANDEWLEENYSNYTVSMAEQAYLLGFIWGDGHLSCRSINKRCYTKIVTVANDQANLIKVLNIVGVRYSRSLYTQSGRQEQGQITISNYEFNSFCHKHLYQDKSHVDCGSVLSEIPERLWRYFLLGLSDADGCWYHNSAKSIRQYTLAGGYDTDWTSVLEVFRNQGIGFKHVKRTHKNKLGKDSKSSILAIF